MNVLNFIITIVDKAFIKKRKIFCVLEHKITTNKNDPGEEGEEEEEEASRLLKMYSMDSMEIDNQSNFFHQSTLK